MKLYVRAAVLLIGITSGVSANSQANQPAEQQFSSHLTQLTSAVLADPRHSLDSRALDKIMAGIKPYFRYSVAPAQQTTVNLDTYLATQVPNHKVERGLALLQEHQGLLDKIGERFGVQPRFILALWGIRSNYGEQAGQFPVLTILASQSQ
ncbi:MAG: lytic murein transglycosylase, partial [Shewanella sp.]